MISAIILNDYKVAERLLLESTVTSSSDEKFALFDAVHKQNVETPKDDYSMISVLLRGYAWLQRIEQQILGYLNDAAFLNKLYRLFSGWQLFHAACVAYFRRWSELTKYFLEETPCAPFALAEMKTGEQKEIFLKFFYCVSATQTRYFIQTHLSFAPTLQIPNIIYFTRIEKRLFC